MCKSWLIFIYLFSKICHSTVSIKYIGYSNFHFVTWYMDSLSFSSHSLEHFQHHHHTRRHGSDIQYFPSIFLTACLHAFWVDSGISLQVSAHTTIRNTNIYNCSFSFLAILLPVCWVRQWLWDAQENCMLVYTMIRGSVQIK